MSKFLFSGINCGSRPNNHKSIMGTTDQPWIVKEAISFLLDLINKDMIGLELGSGSSTFWFSKNIKKIISIENDEKWFNYMNKLIYENNIENIELILKKCKMCDFSKIKEDTEITSEYIDYSNIILENKDFDFIFIDGVARSLCILNAIEILKPGNLLIIDNAERINYESAISKIPNNWIRYEFQNIVDKTIIYIVQ